MLNEIMDELPYIAGAVIETIMFSNLHYVDVFIINVIMTVILLKFDGDIYRKFLIGLWMQYLLLLIYENVKPVTKKSVILDALNAVPH